MSRRRSIHDDFQSDFLRDGYVILRDLFTPEEVEATQRDICTLFETRFSPANTRGLRGRELLAEYYDSHKAMWQGCAKRMQHTLTLQQLACKPALIETLRKAGLVDPMVSTFPEVRTDMPNDDRYMQPWHQDWRSAQGSLNSVTIWLPLHDVRRIDGAISLIPASHLWGLIDYVEHKDPRRYICNDPRVGSSEEVCGELNVGECLLFSQMLVHGSNPNRSGQPRLSAQLRYCDRAEPSYIAAGFPCVTTSELVWDPAPTPEMMRTAYHQT